jgi:flagellar basal-body rod modification protein FlgD
MPDSISSLTAGSLNLGANAPRSVGPSLGNADFLKLLIAQMQHQNPINPTSSTDMVTQLSQFSTVAGIQQMNANFTELMLLQGLTQASNLIGKPITFEQAGVTAPGRGVVSSVQVQSGKVQLMVGSTAVALNQVRTVETPK